MGGIWLILHDWLDFVVPHLVYDCLSYANSTIASTDMSHSYSSHLPAIKLWQGQMLKNKNVI